MNQSSILHYLFRFFSTLCLLITSCISFSHGQNSFHLAHIPAELKNRASAVIRNEDRQLEMRSSNQLILRINKTITVLNENGDEYARIVLFYNKNTQIRSAKGEIYNADGKLTAKFGLSQFRDESAVNDFSIFEDTRLKHYLPIVNSYPYTLVYSIEMVFRQNLMIPDWRPQPSPEVSVENSHYTFISPAGSDFLIQANHLSEPGSGEIIDKIQYRYWHEKQLLAQKPAPYSPPAHLSQKSVRIAAKKFTYYQHEGAYENWEDLGKWYYERLLKNKQELPASTRNQMERLVQGLDSDKEKAKVIYEYLQKKVRYVSIQIGIGGLEPFPASEVDRLSYGDCKGLVNYMQSLLAVVGIESYYCVVEAGRQKISLDPSYPSMAQGNHIILCLPLKGDTTWLECTSQTSPFGYLGDFTDDRYVLACTPEGGKLLKTPKLSTADNLQLRNAQFSIDEEGHLFGGLKTVFSGAQYDNHQLLVNQTLAAQRKYLNEIYAADHIFFDKVAYQEEKGDSPHIVENLELTIPQFAAFTKTSLQFPIYPFSLGRPVAIMRNRTVPFYINRGYTDVDVFTYALPKNVVPLMEPVTKSLSTPFGDYQMNVVIKDGQLVASRELRLYEGTYDPEVYTAFEKFMNEIYRNDRIRVYLSLRE